MLSFFIAKWLGYFTASVEKTDKNQYINYSFAEIQQIMFAKNTGHRIYFKF